VQVPNFLTILSSGRLRSCPRCKGDSKTATVGASSLNRDVGRHSVIIASDRCNVGIRSSKESCTLTACSTSSSSVAAPLVAAGRDRHPDPLPNQHRPETSLPLIVPPCILVHQRLYGVEKTSDLTQSIPDLGFGSLSNGARVGEQQIGLGFWSVSCMPASNNRPVQYRYRSFI
jgi:hypothetical protein